MKVQIDHRIILCTVERKKIKGMYLRMKEKNHLLISCNGHMTDGEIQGVIEKNKNWISKKADLLEERFERTKGLKNHYIELGNIYPIERLQGKQAVEHGKTLKVYSRTEHDKVVERYFDRRTKEILPKIFSNVLREEGLSCQVKLRRMKRRWGTCYPAKRLIILNKELLKLEQNIIRHVILHELCHLEYIYHDENFYRLLRKRDPKYDEHVQYLRTTGEAFLRG